MEHLEELRKQLDSVDDTLLQLLAARMNIIQEVGAIKKFNSLPPLDEKRWQEVLQSRIEKGTELGLKPAFITQVWECFHAEALRIESTDETR